MEYNTMNLYPRGTIQVMRDRDEAALRIYVREGDFAQANMDANQAINIGERLLEIAKDIVTEPDNKLLEEHCIVHSTYE